MTKLFGVKVLILCVCLALAMYHDIKEKKIKNVVTLPTAMVGLILNTVELGVPGMYRSVLGWLLPILGLLILYQIHVLGAGDIKLFAAIGALMGSYFVAFSFVFSIFIGGIIALFILLKRNQLLSRLTYLFNYCLFTFLTQKISAYCTPRDISSKFIFSIAIVPGTLLQLFLTIKPLV